MAGDPGRLFDSGGREGGEVAGLGNGTIIRTPLGNKFGNNFGKNGTFGYIIGRKL